MILHALFFMSCMFAIEWLVQYLSRKVNEREGRLLRENHEKFVRAMTARGCVYILHEEDE